MMGIGLNNNLECRNSVMQTRFRACLYKLKHINSLLNWCIRKLQQKCKAMGSMRYRMQGRSVRPSKRSCLKPDWISRTICLTYTQIKSILAKNRDGMSSKEKYQKSRKEREKRIINFEIDAWQRWPACLTT